MMKKEKPLDMEIITAYGENFLIPSETDCIGQVLKKTGEFQTNDIQRVGEYLDTIRQTKSKRKLFIDIGANIGTHSISAIKDHGFERVLAVEPSESNYRLLTANLCLSGITNRSTCIKAAASEKDGISTLFHNPNNCGDYRLNNSPQGDESENIIDKEQVHTINIFKSIKDETNGTDLNNVLCWIDTQGHEGSIIRSLRPFILKNLAVVIEFWPFGLEQQSYTFEKLANILNKPELEIAHISDKNIQKINLDELRCLWDTLRQKDTGRPEGECHTNLLIYRKRISRSKRSKVWLTQKIFKLAKALVTFK